MQDIPKDNENKTDPRELVCNPPPNRLGELTIIPRGAVNDLAIARTISRMGRNNYWLNVTPLEDYMQNLFAFSRSRGGVLLDRLTQVAQTQVEVEANNSMPTGRRTIM